jgi:hypothetical protein
VGSDGIFSIVHKTPLYLGNESASKIENEKFPGVAAKDVSDLESLRFFAFLKLSC